MIFARVTPVYLVRQLYMYIVSTCSISYTVIYSIWAKFMLGEGAKFKGAPF